MSDKTIPVQAQFEQTKVPMRGEFKTADPVQQQIDDDNRLIPNVGDYRDMIQDGKFISPDGETIIPTKLTFRRIRNKTGGVDVVCMVPAFSMTGKEGEI